MASNEALAMPSRTAALLCVFEFSADLCSVVERGKASLSALMAASFSPRLFAKGQLMFRGSSFKPNLLFDGMVLEYDKHIVYL